MGKMKDLAIHIDEIMEKIEEYSDGYDELSKIYIYDKLSTRCMLKAVLLADKSNFKNIIKENKND